MSNKRNQKRYGLFYVSNGRWTGTPYAGFTFTQYMMNRNPWKQDIRDLKNYVLKSRIKVLRVA
jgi:hypothetical protein